MSQDASRSRKPTASSWSTSPRTATSACSSRSASRSPSAPRRCGNALIDTEPTHLDALVEFASRRTAGRSTTRSEAGPARPLRRPPQAGPRPRGRVPPDARPRADGARRSSTTPRSPPAGREPRPVSDWELASRLSYFLWSSMPDDELRRLAAAGHAARSRRARRPGPADARRRPGPRASPPSSPASGSTSAASTRSTRRASRSSPTSPRLRGAMYEESVRFFMDLFQRDGSLPRRPRRRSHLPRTSARQVTTASPASPGRSGGGSTA